MFVLEDGDKLLKLFLLAETKGKVTSVCFLFFFLYFTVCIFCSLYFYSYS